MPATPKRNNRRSSPNPETPPSQKQRLDGLYRDGNCEPRQPAGHYQVKKPGGTQGKWFYRCRSQRGCNFWQWEDRANTRVRGLLSGRAPEEEGRDEELAPRTPSLPQKPLTSYGYEITQGRRVSDVTTCSGEDDEPDTTGKQAGLDTPCPAGARAGVKRKRDALAEAGGYDSFSDLDSDVEREMVALADATAAPTHQPAARADPRTPATQSTVQLNHGLPTPATARTLFPEASSSQNKRQKTVSFEDVDPETPSKTPATASSPQQTPPGTTPMTSSPPLLGSSNDPVPDPTEEVMALLRPHHLDPSVLRAVQDVLATSVRRTRGVIMGRNSAREVAREKDVRIAKLQERVAILENKERLQNSQITNLKAGIMKVYQDN